MKVPEVPGTKTQILCSAVLFDMDGVLLDSIPSVERQWTIWAKRHNLDPAKVLAIAHGVRTAETVRKLTPHLDAEKEAKSIEIGEMEDTGGLRALPGAKEMVQSLPPDRWAIVTSATRALATARLGFVGLPIPQLMVTADDVKHGKPHPEPYLTGAARLGYKPEDCLVVEDAPAGIRAARSAGMKVLAVTTTHSASILAEVTPDVTVASLQEVAVRVQNGEIAIEVLLS